MSRCKECGRELGCWNCAPESKVALTFSRLFLHLWIWTLVFGGLRWAEASHRLGKPADLYAIFRPLPPDPSEKSNP